MKLETLTNKQAAFLYLLNFNIEESGNEKYTQLLDLSKIFLKTTGWNPNPVFDHDGNPMIEYPDGFDANAWMLNPNFNDDAPYREFHQLEPDEPWYGYLKGKIQAELDLLFNDWVGVDILALIARIEQID